jgi:hypothetical protein
VIVLTSCKEVQGWHHNGNWPNQLEVKVWHGQCQ